MGITADTSPARRTDRRRAWLRFGEHRPGFHHRSVALTPVVIDTLFSFGETAQLSAVAKDGSGARVPGAAIAYQSSATSVATVTPDGAVTAAGNGVATVTATSGTASASVAVRVRQKLARVVVVPATGGVPIGRTITLSVTGADLRGNAMSGLPAPTFTSSNTGAATVDAAGVVTGVGLGSATISANVTSTADGAKSGTAVITATAPPPPTATVTMGAATFSPTSAEISVGGVVTWVNPSAIPHDVDFGTPAMRIAVFDTGQRSMTFPVAGTFGYHCNLHAGMTGTIAVR
ncbi:MAG: Ig-like domain-containing protein [Longimicrobiales bacterium]|nr:Ig-like domain-containing protein [Longimicrobiales bacterium]